MAPSSAGCRAATLTAEDQLTLLPNTSCSGDTSNRRPEPQPPGMFPMTAAPWKTQGCSHLLFDTEDGKDFFAVENDPCCMKVLHLFHEYEIKSFM